MGRWRLRGLGAVACEARVLRGGRRHGPALESAEAHDQRAGDGDAVEAVHVDGLPLRQHEQPQQLGGALVRQRHLLSEDGDALGRVPHAVGLAPLGEVRHGRLGQQRDDRAQAEAREEAEVDQRRVRAAVYALLDHGEAQRRHERRKRRRRRSRLHRKLSEQAHSGWRARRSATASAETASER